MLQQTASMKKAKRPLYPKGFKVNPADVVKLWVIDEAKDANLDPQIAGALILQKAFEAGISIKPASANA